MRFSCKKTISSPIKLAFSLIFKFKPNGNFVNRSRSKPSYRRVTTTPHSCTALYKPSVPIPLSLSLFKIRRSNSHSSLFIYFLPQNPHFLSLGFRIQSLRSRKRMSLRPSARTEVRRNRYKVAVDAEEGRRRREDNMVEIRKNRREESLQKKRREGLQPQQLPASIPTSALEKKVYIYLFISFYMLNICFNISVSVI